MSYFGFTEITDKSKCLEADRMNNEKLKGRFKLKIKKSLPEPMRIAQFANEDVAFHLHKRRDFFRRLEGSNDPDIGAKTNEKLIAKIRKRLEDHKQQLERQKWEKQFGKNWKNQVSQNQSQQQGQNSPPLLKSSSSNNKLHNQSVSSYANESSNKRVILPTINGSFDLSRNNLSVSSMSMSSMSKKKDLHVSFDENMAILNQRSSIQLKPTEILLNEPEIIESKSINSTNSKQKTIFDKNIKNHQRRNQSQISSNPFMVTMFNNKKLSQSSSIEHQTDLHNQSTSSIQQLNDDQIYIQDNPYQEQRRQNPKLLINQPSSEHQNVNSSAQTKFISNIKKMLTRQFTSSVERLQESEQEVQRRIIRRKLLKIQKACVEQNSDTEQNLEKINKSLDRETKLKDNVSFTVKTLQELDHVEPQGLDILFEYKVNDINYQKNEANQIAREYRLRNLDPARNIIEKLELENGSRKRRFKSMKKI
ncbi:UNKNOWN [Stylonychia lemnae]|uniref:Uncharacterized protein n=1 Tax=Stylonychia lemnae TaxID=5949 RepID=A0A078AT99_STYLE|nr:UNKNOWN [Stylonychia lemnae]|eukprot:CDW85246.1 UNKNOWN [Stylonychia lemnae]